MHTNQLSPNLVFVPPAPSKSGVAGCSGVGRCFSRESRTMLLYKHLFHYCMAYGSVVTYVARTDDD